MLVSCSSCKSKYLVNSADLKPSGRKVQCAKCGHSWFQTASIDVEEELRISSSLNNNAHKEENNPNAEITNLPSTYVKKPKASMLNSILMIIFLIVSIGFFWFVKTEGINSVILINFYFKEFFFNLELIINDLAKIFHQILN